MRILVVGAGATGGYYGGKLVEAGRDVTFLLRQGRAEQIRECGLEIIGPGGHVKVQPKIVTADQLRVSGERFDLILISTKSYQLGAAMEDFASAVGPGTMLVPVLNGMRHLAALDARFGAESVIPGSVRVVSDMDERGRVIQLATMDDLSYGERSRERTARIEAVHEAMQGAGFETVLQPDILATLWRKWWMLASMGAICILARGTSGQVADAPRGVEFASAVLGEAAGIAAANGYPPSEDAFSGHLKRMTEPGSALTSSLYRDMIRGAPVEADHILGDLLDRANGVDARLLTAAYVQLKVFEAQRMS